MCLTLLAFFNSLWVTYMYTLHNHKCALSNDNYLADLDGVMLHKVTELFFPCVAPNDNPLQDSSCFQYPFNYILLDSCRKSRKYVV